MTEPNPDLERKPRPRGGRPPCVVSGQRVRQLRDQGSSWRCIARTLGIGTATAQRLYKAICGVPEASQNSRTEVPDHHQGTGPADAPAECECFGEVLEVYGSAPATESPLAIPRIKLGRIRPSGNRVGDIRTGDKVPGPCANCRSRTWRLMPDGSLACCVCYPLPG
jgi:hypothetical protein